MQGPSLEIQWSQVTWWLRTCLAMEKICRFDPWSGNSDPTYHRATTDPTCHSERFLMMKQRLHVLQLRHNTAKYIHTYCLKKRSMPCMHRTYSLKFVTGAPVKRQVNRLYSSEG